MVIRYLGLWSAQGPVGRTMASSVSGRRTWLARSTGLEIELTGGSPPPVASHTTPYSPLRQAGMGLSPPVVTPSSGSPRPQDGGRTQPGSPAAVAGSSTTAFPSVMAFIDSLELPLQEPLIKTAPRPRQGRRIDDSVVPRRSDRLAAKSVFRDPQPEKQAKRVVMNKWRRRPDDAVSCTTDATVGTKFHNTFAEPLSSSKRAAMRELFPMRGTRRARAAPGYD